MGDVIPVLTSRLAFGPVCPHTQQLHSDSLSIESSAECIRCPLSFDYIPTVFASVCAAKIFEKLYNFGLYETQNPLPKHQCGISPSLLIQNFCHCSIL